MPVWFFKYLLPALGAGVLLFVAYQKGAGDKDREWTNKDNRRIIAEQSATLQAERTARALELKDAVEAAVKAAVLEERKAAAEQRAEIYEQQASNRRRENAKLRNDLETSQQAAIAAGDNSGLAPLPDGVRDQLADLQDALCARGYDCGGHNLPNRREMEDPPSPDLAGDAAGYWPQ